MKKNTIKNVSAQRQSVQALIANAQATEAALIAAERSLDTLDSALASYAGR